MGVSFEPAPIFKIVQKRPLAGWTSLWARPAGAWTDATALTLILAIAGIAAYIGAVHSTIYGHDVFLMFDAGWRVLNGQRPDVDFSPSMGPSLGLLFAAALKLARNSSNAAGYASAMVGAAAGLAGYWLTRRSLAAIPAVLASATLTLIAVAPFPVGLPPNAFSQAMLYNRYGYALTGVVLLEAFQDSRYGGRARAICGGFITGLISIALLFLKPSYGLVALAFAACSYALVRHSPWRLAGIALGLLLSGAAMMAYLRFDFAAVWNDLALMSAAKGSAVGFWTIRWAVSRGLADFLPLALLGYLCGSVEIRGGPLVRLGEHKQGAKAIALALLVFAGGALLLATNGQLRGFPLNAVLALLLIERTSPRRGKDGVLILIGLISFVPVFVGSAAGLGFALIESTRNPSLAEAARFTPPHLAKLISYDVPDGTEADRRSNGRAYVTYINSGVDLLERNSLPNETISTLDVQNPFSYALLRRPAPGGGACLSFNHTFNDRHKPSAEWLFGSDIVMIPKHPSAAQADADALSRNYLASIKTRYRLCAESDWWELYKRPGNTRGCPVP